MLDQSENPVYYSSLVSRFQAASIDIFVLIIAFLIVVSVIAASGIESGPVKMTLTLTPFLIEPLLLSLFGATLGYFLLSQKVEKRDSHRNLNFF